jgi:hypothetical protein
MLIFRKAESDVAQLAGVACKSSAPTAQPFQTLNAGN